jgi:hypothetical protein
MTRAAFLAWAVLICPSVGWLIAVLLIEGADLEDMGWATLFGVPPLLAAATGVIAGRPQGEIALGVVGSITSVGLTLVLIAIYLTSQGVFD